MKHSSKFYFVNKILLCDKILFDTQDNVAKVKQFSNLHNSLNSGPFGF